MTPGVLIPKWKSVCFGAETATLYPSPPHLWGDRWASLCNLTTGDRRLQEGLSALRFLFSNRGPGVNLPTGPGATVASAGASPGSVLPEL